MSNIEKQYLNLLDDILKNGRKKTDRTGTGTISVFGRQLRHDFRDGFPLLTTKRMAFKAIVTELLWFLRGETNIKYLVDNGCHIWDGDAYKNYCIEWKKTHKEEPPSKEQFIQWVKDDINDGEFVKKWGNLGPIYGKQWRNWENEIVNYAGQKYNSQTIDQIQQLINDLKTNPDSRRLMVSAWNVGELHHMVLPPCHYGFQVYTRELSFDERVSLSKQDKSQLYTSWGGDLMDEEGIPKRAISLMWNQRSVDTFLGLPFNIASYALLLMIIAKEVNMIPDELIGNLGDTHLYLNHVEQAKEQLSRQPYGLPELEIMDNIEKDLGKIPFNEILRDMTPHDFVVNNYQSHPTIKAPLSN